MYQFASRQNNAPKNRTASSRKQPRLTMQALSTCRHGRPHEIRVAYSGAMSAEQSMMLQAKAMPTSVLVMKRISGVRMRPLHRKLNEISIQTGRFLSVAGTVRKPSHGGTQSASSIRIPASEWRLSAMMYQNPSSMGACESSQLFRISTAAAWSMMGLKFLAFLPAWCSFSCATVVVRYSST